MNRARKPKQCAVCSTEFIPTLRNAAACGVDCALKLHYRQTLRKKQRRGTQQVRQLNKETIAWQHKATKPVFNKMRVLQELLWFQERGLNPRCISCGKENMDWACGHYKSVGAQSNLRYDERNTYLQCNRYCNMALSGNIEGTKTTRGYKVGLRDRFGAAQGQAILDYCEQATDSATWTWQELESMRQGFAAQVRTLQRTING